MTNNLELEIIHIVWQGPLMVQETAVAKISDDYGVYQIYGAHEVSGPDTLLYIGYANCGTFDNRILYHSEEWGRWNPDEVKIYLGRLAGLESITDDAWGKLIDRAEAVLIWKIGVPFNAARIKSLPAEYQDKPILVVNHGRIHRLPECASTLTEFINSDIEEFKNFGPSGHSVAPPVLPPNCPAEEE